MSKNSIAVLVVTGAVAVSLSLVSFQYSNFNANEILKIAAEDARSNAKIQAHDLNRILVNGMSSIATNLQIIANSPAMQNNEFERGQILINTAQNSTGKLTNFYMWLDSDGKLVWLSNLNQTGYESFRGTDLSHRSYFIEPKNTLDVYYSGLIDSNDNITRLYIVQPIVNKDTGAFNGVVAAGIRLDTFGTFLQQELPPGFQSTFGMIDREGELLYSQNQTLIGKNIFGPEIQSLIPPNLKDSFNEFIKQSLRGQKGIADFTAGNTTSTIAYEPIFLGGEQFGTLYISTPHRFAENVNLLVDQQRNFSIIIDAVIGGAAIGVAIMVIIWNTTLRKVVNTRTGELKRSHDSLAAANEQLKVHDRLQKEFINIAAHELRTPTQAILGYAELLQMNPADRDEMIKAIYRNSVRLQRLTSDILDVTRIESDALRIDKEKFNLKDVIQGAIQDAYNQLANGKVKLLYDPQDVYIQADRGRITQVVANLLDNALKFTKEGTITVSTENKNGQVVISVKDTGSGIDPGIMPRLFSKFATKSDRGTGLGLFISRSIIEAHDGTIWCTNNTEGKGATFAFSLPVSQAEASVK